MKRMAGLSWVGGGACFAAFMPTTIHASRFRHPPGIYQRFDSWGFRAERRAAPKPARRAMCKRLNAARIAVPSGAEAGHGKS